jgi:uncharacterized protein YjdB
MTTSHRTHRVAKVAIAAALCAIVPACGGGGGDSTSPPPNVPTLSGITVAPTSVTLSGVGTSAALAATLAPAGVSATVTWSSDNATIATVSGSGASATVTAVAAGTTRVVARAGAFESAASVVVVPIVRRVALPTDTVRLLAGASQPISATIDADAGANAALTWTSNAATIASVSSTGVISALAPGVAVITATSVAFPALSASIPVRVTLPPVTVVISPANPSALTGSTRQLTATVTAAAGVATTVIWGTTAPLVANVSASGLVSAIAAGTATITATSTANPTVSATTVVTVTNPTVRAITLTPTIATLFPQSTRQITATFDADAGANTDIQWASSNNAVATVSAAGLVTGVSLGGPVTITATSVLVSTVKATAQVTVSAPPPATTYTLQGIGVAPYLGGNVPFSLVSLNATDALMGLGTQGGGGGTFRNFVLQRSGGVLRDITPSCCGDAGLPLPIAAASATDALVTFTGDLVFAMKPPQVARWNGATFTDVAWPTASGFLATAPRALRRVPTGEYIALSTTNLLYRFANGTWTRIDSLQASQSFATDASGFARDSAFAYVCDLGNVPTMFRSFGGTQNTMPSPPGLCTGRSQIGNMLAARADSLTMVVPGGAALWNGNQWRVIALPSSADTITAITDCNGTRFAAGLFGDIYQQTGNSFVRIATDGEVVALADFSAGGVRLSCAPDGTLRVLSGGALLVRRAGNSWVEENYAPDLSAVSMTSTTSGYAVGDGVVFRWNGAQWTMLRRTFAGTERLRAVIASADGSMLSVGSTRNGNTTLGLLLRSNGSTFTATQVPAYTGFRALAPIETADAFAIATASAGQSVQLVRISGNTAFAASGFTGVPNLVASSGSNNAFVVRSDASTARFDGTSWTELANVSVASGASLNTLVTFAANSAFVGECSGFATSSIFRFNGTSWVPMTLPAGITTTCVRSLYGTSASDLYALVQISSSPDVRRVLRWDGTQWTALSTPDFADAKVGSATVGLSALVGFGGFGAIATPPAGFRIGN